MSRVQDLITRVLPGRWADAIEAESRRWMIRCRCGFEQSVWDRGGLRYKARGRKKQLLRCPHCGDVSWHQVYLPD